LTKNSFFVYTPGVQNEGNENPNPTTPSSQTYEYGQPPKKRSPKKLLLLIGAVLVVLVVLNTLRILGSKEETPAPTPTPSIEDFSVVEPTEEATLEPTATPTPTPKVNPKDLATGLDRSELSVRIENGSVVTGAAAEASTYLKSLGYNVVSIGNADNTDYTDVTIRVKSSQKDFLPLLNKDLSSKYSIGTTSSDLSATASADALVIIGK